jgi:uridylate kinase
MTRRRVLLKMSGESLCHQGGFGIDAKIVLDLARQIQAGLAGKDVSWPVVGGGTSVASRSRARDRPRHRRQHGHAHTT